MGDENTKKRKFPWKASYSTLSTNETEERIDITMEDLASNIIPIEEMMQQAGYIVGEEDSEAIKATKEEVYKQIVRYLRIEGFPTESTPGFKGQGLAQWEREAAGNSMLQSTAIA